MKAFHPLAAMTAAALLLALPAGASAQATEVKENIDFVKNIAYPDLQVKGTKNLGTDLEFAEIKGREYSFAGSYNDGLQAIDITEPEQARLVGTLDCGIAQGDVQVFQREDLGGRWFATYTYDNGYTFNAGSACVRQVEALGFKPRDVNGDGTYIVDITDPANMKAVSFIPISEGDLTGIDFDTRGSHNGTVHPSGKYFYNSNADLITGLTRDTPEIEVIDISKIEAPVQVATVPLKTLPGLGTESHDITFSDDGKRAYSAALSHAAIIDTTNPAKPVNIGTVVDPAINVWHQSDPVTIKDPLLGERRFLVVEDEVAGAAGTGQCPNGGVHVYDMTGDLEKNPVKVGYWNIAEPRATDQEGATDIVDPLGGCTAHVFDIHEDEKLMTIAYYNGGVRVVDLSGLVGVALGKQGVGMKELGFHRFTGAIGTASNVWAVKAPKVKRDKPFFLYANDHRRGFDVFRFKPAGGAKLEKSRDTWMTPAQQRRAAAEAELRVGKPKLAALCLLGDTEERRAKVGRAAAAAGLSGQDAFAR
jgi:hypothetical protein